MSTKTLENLLRQSELNIKQPLEAWKQLQRGKSNYRPDAAALARCASLDLGLCAAGR